ncbi:MAG: DUF1080 domain-containing protein [Bacteroidales bacterium]
MRNILKLFILVVVATVMISCSGGKKNTNTGEEIKCEKSGDACCDKAKSGDVAPNTLSEQEEKEGWELLFDGKTTNGWRGYNKATVPTNWTVEDGALSFKGSGQGEAGDQNAGGDIIYDKEFNNFTIKFEWKISEGGNSGVFYLGKEVEGWPLYKTAPEYQILDNAKHPDAKLGKDGNRQSASLYDLIPAVPQNSKPAGEWNTGEIIVYRGTVVHKQNGENVLEYHLWTDDWKALVKDSKFPGLNPDWAEVAKEGYFGLQDHGDDVWYRNIKYLDMN